MATKTRNRMKRTRVVPHPSASCPSCFRGSISVLGCSRARSWDTGEPGTADCDMTLGVSAPHRKLAPAGCVTVYGLRCTVYGSRTAACADGRGDAARAEGRVVEAAGSGSGAAQCGWRRRFGIRRHPCGHLSYSGGGAGLPAVGRGQHSGSGRVGRQPGSTTAAGMLS